MPQHNESLYDEHGPQIARSFREGQKVEQISTDLNVPAYQVRIQLKKQGVPLSQGKKSAKTPEKVQEAVALLEGGSTVRKTSLALQIPYQTLLRWLREEGVDTSAHQDWVREREEKAPEAVRLYTEQKMPIYEVARTLGVSQQRASRWLKEEGVELRTVPGDSKNRSKRELWIEQALRLHSEGKTSAEISREVDAHASTIDVWIRQEGLVPNYVSASRESGRKEEYEEKRTRALALYMDGVLITEAADEVGVNRTSVQRWINEAGLEGQGGQTVRNRRDAAEAVRLYTEDGLSIDEIQRQMGKGHYQVKGWLTGSGVRIKSAWERKTPEQISAMRQAAVAATTGVPRGKRASSPVPTADLLIKKMGHVPEKICVCGKVFTDAQNKYCSPECRNQYGGKRQKDPTNYTTFNCLNCSIEIIRYKGSGAHKYCSNSCARRHTKTKQHIVVEDSIVLDSSYETLFWSICMLNKIPIERYDREQGVEWRPGLWYAPDFWMPTLGFAVEVKGLMDDEDPEKWDAFRQEVGSLIVLTEAKLRQMIGGKGDMLKAMLG